MLTASDLIHPAWKWGAAAVLTLGLLALFTWQHLALKSAQEALSRLLVSVGQAEKAVARCTTLPITPAQFDALVSLTYNIGVGAYCESTLVRRLNAGDCLGAASEFDRWVRVQGRVVPGLVTRRADERRRFQAGCGA